MKTLGSGKGALGPGYFGLGVPIGTLVAVFAAAAGSVGGLALGLAVIAGSAFVAMDRMADGPSRRSAAWLGVYSLLTLGAVALAAAVHSRLAMYLLIAAGVVGAPWLATKVVGGTNANKGSDKREGT